VQARLGFGHADAANRWMRKHRAGDIFVINPAVHPATEQAFAQPAPGSDGNRCQRRPAGDVTDGMDAGNIGVLVVIYRNSTVR
jgi:hypothetical protein